MFDKITSHNCGFKKLAVQWLQDVQFFRGTFVVTDSLVLRNRQLLVGKTLFAILGLHNNDIHYYYKNATRQIKRRY